MLQTLLHTRGFKCIAIAVIIAFVSMIPAQSGYAQVSMPQPGQMILPTDHFTPPLMRGIRVDQKDPFRLYFVMTDGQKVLAQDTKTEEYRKLIKYFMASLATPNNDMWVNLSPVEADRIIPDNFSMTEMGRDLLAQDYILKQFAASLMSPETELGKTFWAQVYEKAYEDYGTTNIPVDTFNKVWIMPDKADIYQKDDTAILVKSHLKVMLESDYLAAQQTGSAAEGTHVGVNDEAQQLAKQIVRNVIVPVIEKEVNEGGNFVEVRQAYSAMIMATWFKKALKESLLGQVYADQSKVDGIALNDPDMKNRIYQQYLQAYKTGVFNFIKDEFDPVSREVLPRKYFAGGLVPIKISGLNTAVPFEEAVIEVERMGPMDLAEVSFDAAQGARIITQKPLKKQNYDPRVNKYRARQASVNAQEKVAWKDFETAKAKLAEDRKNAKQPYIKEQKTVAAAKPVFSSDEKKEAAIALTGLVPAFSPVEEKDPLVTAYQAAFQALMDAKTQRPLTAEEKAAFNLIETFHATPPSKKDVANAKAVIAAYQAELKDVQAEFDLAKKRLEAYQKKAKLEALASAKQTPVARTSSVAFTSGEFRWRKYVLMGLTWLNLFSAVQVPGANWGTPGQQQQSVSTEQSAKIIQAQEAKTVSVFVATDRFTGKEVSVSADTTALEVVGSGHHLLGNTIWTEKGYTKIQLGMRLIMGKAADLTVEQQADLQAHNVRPDKNGNVVTNIVAAGEEAKEVVVSGTASGTEIQQAGSSTTTVEEQQAASSASTANVFTTVSGAQEQAKGFMAGLDMGRVVKYVGDTIALAARNTAEERFKTVQRLVNSEAVSVIASLDNDNLHDTIKVFRSFAGNGKDPNAFQDFQYSLSKPEFRIFRVPSSNTGAIDYSKVEQWDEIKNMLDVEKEQQANKAVVVVVNWKDADGQQKKGILWAGSKAARINAEMAIAASLDRKFTQDILAVLDIKNPDARTLELQRQEIKSRFGIDSLNNQQLFVGVRVERDVYGNIIKVKSFIESDEVDVQQSAKPVKHTNLVVRQNGKTDIIKFWPFKDQGLKVFSVVTPSELANGGSTTNNIYSEDENPYSRGEIIFGQNYNYKNKAGVDIADMMDKINKQALVKYEDYLEGKLSLARGFGGMQLFASFTPFALPMHLLATASNLAYDLAKQPSLIVSRKDMENFLGKYLYLKRNDMLGDSVAIQDTVSQDVAWEKLKRSEQKKYTTDALKNLDKFYSEDDMDVIFHYIEVRKKEGEAMFILNQFSVIAPYVTWFLPTARGYFDAPGLVIGGNWYVGPDGELVPENPTWIEFDRAKYPILNDILNQKYVSFTGEVNIPQVFSLFTTGQGMNNIPVTQLFSNTKPHSWWTGGMEGKQIKPTWLNGSIFEKIFSVVGVTVNLQSVVNALSVTEDPLDVPFKNAPTTPRINLYLFGYPISTEFEFSLVKNLNRMVNDTNCAAYMVHDGVFRSKAYQYSQKEFDALFVAPGVTRVVIGKVSMGAKGRDVPVYMVLETNPDGTKHYRIFIPTEAGLKAHKEEVQKDIENYDTYAAALDKGGYIQHTGAQGGTYQQNNATGLFESHSQQSQIYLDNSYTWDQMLMVHRALLSNDTTIATGILDVYATQFNATTKSGEDFQGFTTSFRAYTGMNVGSANSAVTAMVGNTIMAYEKKTGDMRYHHMLAPIAEWLAKMQKNTGTGGVRLGPMDNDTIWTGPQRFVRKSYTEPNALVYSFFNTYSQQQGADKEKYTKAAGKILEWAKGYGWDVTKSLLNNAHYSQAHSADGQTRWMRALGVKDFTKQFIDGKLTPDGKADSFEQYVQRMVTEFEVTVTDEHTGLKVTLLDLADPKVAQTARGMGADSLPIRMGFPEVTSEFIAVLNEAKTEFPAQADYFQTLIDRYTASLNALRATPEMNGSLPQATGKNIPTGFGWNTPLGSQALGSLAQFDLTGANKNVLDLQSQGAELPKIDRPATPAEEKDLVMPVVSKDYEAQRIFIAKLVELKEYEGNKLVWANPNGQEIIYVNAIGRKVHVVLITPTSKIEERKELMEKNRDVADQIAQALAAEGAYAPTAESSGMAGGVLFTTPDGSRIGGVQDARILEALITKINTLSVQERNWILNKNFSNFAIDFDVDSTGVDQKVVATVFFPMDVPITVSRMNPVSGLIEQQLFINGRLIKTTDANGATTINYNHLRVEETSATVNAQGLVTDETWTVESKIIDPLTVNFDAIDPTDPIMVKGHLDKITGVVSIDTYGLFNRPITSVTPKVITKNSFDPVSGNWTGAEEFQNKGTLENPVPGRLLRTLTIEGTDHIRALPEFQQGKFTFVKQTDNRTSKVQYIVFDNAKFGRRYAEIELRHSGQGFDERRVRALQYDETLLSGRVPTHGTMTVTTYSIKDVTRIRSVKTYDSPKLKDGVDKNAATLGEFLKKNVMIIWKDGTFEYASESAIKKNMPFTQTNAKEILIQDLYGQTIGYKFILNVIEGFDNDKPVTQKGLYNSDHGLYLVRFKDQTNAFSTTAFIQQRRDELVKAGALVAQDGAYTISLNEIKARLDQKDLDPKKLSLDDFKNNGKCIYFKSTPQEDEIEVGDSLYRYSTYNKNSRPFEVVKRLKITEVDGKWVLVVSRQTLSGITTRTFGVVVGPSRIVKNEDIGRELMQLYSWKTADGRTMNRAVVDHEAKASILDPRIRSARGYTGEEAIRNIYDSPNAGGESYFFDQKTAVLRGYSVVTGDTIFAQGAQPWAISEEISLDGKFISARAIDRYGKERAVITKLLDAPDAYQIEVISYGEDGIETGRVIHKAQKARDVYELGVEMARANKLYGAIKADAVTAYEEAKKALSPSDREILDAGIRNVVTQSGDFQINAGILSKANDGTFVIYRISGDPLNRIIAQHSIDTDSWQINLSWDDEGSATSSRIIKGGQVVSLASSDTSTVADILKDNLYPQRVVKDFEKAQEYVNGESLSFEEYLKLYGLEQSSPLPTVNDVLYQKKGVVVFDLQGRVVRDDVVYDQQNIEKQVTMYLLPNDPQGRTFITRYPTAKGEKLVFNMWNWQQRVKAPVGIVPGSITLDGDRIEVEEFSALTDTVQWYNTKTDRLETKSVLDVTGGKTKYAFVYKVYTNNDSKISQRVYLNGGDVFQEYYPYRVATLANKVAQNEAGVMEVVQYHIGLPYAVPQVAFKSTTGEWIKKWKEVSYQIDDENAAEQIFTGKEPLAPNKQATWKYVYNRFGEQVKAEKMIMADALQEIEDEVVAPLPGVDGASPWYTFGGLILALGLAIGGLKSFLKRKWRNSAEKTRVVPKEPPPTRVNITPDEKIELQEFMQNVLGPDVTVKENNAIVMRVAEIVSKLGKGLDMTLQDLENPSLAFDHVAVMELFEQWLKDIKESDPQGAYVTAPVDLKSLLVSVKDHLTPIQFIVLSEICFSLAKELRHSNPSVVWYYLYRALKNIEEQKGINGLPQFFTQMNADMEAVRVFLNNEYPNAGMVRGKNDPRVIRPQYVVLEDMEDNFKDPNFLQQWEAADGDKLQFLNEKNTELVARRTADLESKNKTGKQQSRPLGLKTETDAVGLKNYVKNLWPVIRTLLPVFVLTAVVPAALYFGLGIAFTWVGMLGTMAAVLLVSNLLIRAGNQRYLKAVTALNGFVPDQRKVEISNFNKFFNVFSVLFVAWNYAAFSFSYPVLAHAFLIGAGSMATLPLLGIGVLMTLVVVTFELVSSWAIAYPTLTMFAWRQGNKDRVGEVKNLEQAVTKVAQAKEEFKKVLAPSLQGRYQAIWDTYADDFVDVLMRDHFIEEKERPYLRVILGQMERGALDEEQEKGFAKFLQDDPKREELHDRIVRSVGSWYMNMPQMLEWDQWPTFTPLSTAFTEDIANNYGELNDADKNGGMTPLNWFISKYSGDFERMVKKEIPDPAIQGILHDHFKAVLEDKDIARKLDVDKDVQQIILLWVAAHFIRLDRSIAEIKDFKRTYEFWAKAFFPTATPEEIQQKVQEKLQMFLIYAGFGMASPDNQANLVRSLASSPDVEVFLGTGPMFNDSLYRIKAEFINDIPAINQAYEQMAAEAAAANAKMKTGELIAKFFDEISTPVLMDSKVPVAVSGKTTSQNAAFQFVRGEVWLPFDSNLSIRFEEAIKTPITLAEFKKDLRTGLVLCAEHINTKTYSWLGEALAFGEEAWTNVMQRSLDLYGASGFYGHSAFIRTDITRAAGGLSTFYTSEDLLLAMRFWLAGYDTIHREYAIFGKGRDRSYISSLVALGKWSEGSAELILGRQMKRAMKSDLLHMPRKMMLAFALSFYPKESLVVPLSFVYLMTFVFLGVSPYVGFAFGVAFGLGGLLVSQAINVTGLLYLSERHGFWKGTKKFLAMFPKLYLAFVAVIPTYAQRILKGFAGASGFVLSPRGYDLEMIPFKSPGAGNIGIWALPTGLENSNLFQKKEFKEGMTIQKLLAEISSKGYEVINEDSDLKTLNNILLDPKLHEIFGPINWPNGPGGSRGKFITDEGTGLIKKGNTITKEERIRLNRLVLEAVFPVDCPKNIEKANMKPLYATLGASLVGAALVMLPWAVATWIGIGVLTLAPVVIMTVWRKLIFQHALRLQLVLGLAMMPFVALGIVLWGGMFGSVWVLGAWVAQFAAIIASIVFSVNDHPRGVLLSMGTAVGIIAAASYLFSPIFILFAFSGFYLGQPVVWLLMPFIGHIRMKARISWVLDSARDSVKSFFGGLKKDKGDKPSAVPTPTPPTPPVPQVAVPEAVMPAQVDDEKKANWLGRKAQALKSLKEYLQNKLSHDDSQADALEQEQANKTQDPTELGGIDMNADHLAINIKVDGEGLPLPMGAQLPELSSISGLSPVIIGITSADAGKVPVLLELMTSR